MKKTIIISIILISVIAAICFCNIQGCWDVLREKRDIYVGFNYENDLPVIAAAKSPTNVFDIDDVTIDFYYGIARDIYEDHAALCTYLCMRTSDIQHFVEDYRSDFEEASLLDVKTRDEFLNGPFDVKIEWKALLGEPHYFRFKNTLTIPKEMLSEEETTIYFAVVLFREIDKENFDNSSHQIDLEKMNYMIDDSVFIKLNCKKIDENTVKVSAERRRY